MFFIRLILIFSKTICAILAFCFALKTYRAGNNSSVKSMSYIWYLLSAIFLCDVWSDFSWILSLTAKLELLPSIDILPFLVLFSKRLAWVIDCIEYLLLAIFLQQFIRSNTHQTWIRILLYAPCIALATTLAYISVADFYVLDQAQRTFEFRVYGCIYHYVCGVLFYMIVSAFLALWRKQLPTIVHRQLSIFTYGFLLPHALLVCLSINYFTIVVLKVFSLYNYVLIALNDFVCLASLFFCVKRMLNLRFLNVYKRVARAKKYHFVNDFKNVLVNLGIVESLSELEALTQKFFPQAFQIKQEYVQFYIRATDPATDATTAPPLFTEVKPEVEAFFARADNATLQECILNRRVLIRDELGFDTFYGEEPHAYELFAFLENITADIFLPIYRKKTLIAYIIIGHGARPHELFSALEHDEMHIFANYLSAIIYLIQHHSIQELAQEKQLLQSELYTKERRLQHYKESVRSLLQTSSQQTVGVGTYHHRKLAWTNSTFRTMLRLSSEQGEHAMHTPSVMQLCSEVARYGHERSITLTMESGHPVQCIATPDETKSRVLLLTQYAHLADTFTVPFEKLDDLAAWEYALYLETTQSGQLINQAIPGKTPTTLNLKIELLKVALTKKAVLLEMPFDDTLPIATMLHHISLRSKLHTITLSKPERAQEIGIVLFGMEATIAPDVAEPVLSCLHEVGTLFIQNIELLSLPSQERLAEFMVSGGYRPLSSERVVRSNVRCICSTSAQLAFLVEQQKFSTALFAALRSATVSFTSLLTLPRHELVEIAQNLATQSVQSVALRPLMALNSKEVDLLVAEPPLSFHELKERVYYILRAKSYKHNIENLVNLDPALQQDSPPEILQALRTGKKALQDKTIMILLWNHFKNQAKIALLLNVNRSSVSRRCKEFNITPDEPGS